MQPPPLPPWRPAAGRVRELVLADSGSGSGSEGGAGGEDGPERKQRRRNYERQRSLLRHQGQGGWQSGRALGRCGSGAPKCRCGGKATGTCTCCLGAKAAAMAAVAAEAATWVGKDSIRAVEAKMERAIAEAEGADWAEAHPELVGWLYVQFAPWRQRKRGLQPPVPAAAAAASPPKAPAVAAAGSPPRCEPRRVTNPEYLGVQSQAAGQGPQSQAKHLAYIQVNGQGRTFAPGSFKDAVAAARHRDGMLRDALGPAASGGLKPTGFSGSSYRDVDRAVWRLNFPTQKELARYVAGCKLHADALERAAERRATVKAAAAVSDRQWRTERGQATHAWVTGCREATSSSCSICLSPCDAGSDTSILECRHAFHRECLRHWRRTHDTCPVCRGAIKGTILHGGASLRRETVQGQGGTRSLSASSGSSDDELVDDDHWVDDRLVQCTGATCKWRNGEFDALSQSEQLELAIWAVQCDRCHGWSHGQCVALAEPPAEEQQWFCEPCVRAEARLEQIDADLQADLRKLLESCVTG
jgi:hypothetical protein